MDKTNQVTVIGLGAMGAVLARLLLGKGYAVTAWNRSREKAQPLVNQGAVFTADLAAAIQASPVIIICVTDYRTTNDLLGTDAISALLAGRLLVQLSTGTPQDARDAAAWAHSKGASYLDGAILATPSQMGRPDTPIFLSGTADAYRQGEPLLKALAGTLLYMGEAAGAAAAWDLSVLSSMFGMMMGFFHGARIMEAEGIPVDALGGMIAEIAPVLGEMVKDTSRDIRQENYGAPESSLEICASTFDLLIRQAGEAGINAEIPTATLQLFNKARTAGYGHERLAAVIKTLRARA
ncbi:NAD(P)-binding domain-containing protein [Chitinophaga japonensis]